METEKTTDNTKSIFERTEVRKIKGNNEESIFFDSKEDALNCLRSHNGQNKSEEDLVRSEFARMRAVAISS